MKRQKMMPIIHNQASMWQLNADRRSVRMQLPGLPIAGSSEPLLVNIDFDAAVVDQIIERLGVAYPNGSCAVSGSDAALVLQ
jgi:hypothetical protein